MFLILDINKQQRSLFITDKHHSDITEVSNGKDKALQATVLDYNKPTTFLALADHQLAAHLDWHYQRHGKRPGAE